MKYTEKWMSLVWTVLLMLVLMSVCPDRTTTEAAVNPSVNGDGDIVWGEFDPIPPSTLDNSFESIHRPQVVADMARNFGILVVNGLPYEAIRKILMEIQKGPISDSDAVDAYWQVASSFVGVVILVLFGVFLFLVVPLVGLFFCCCRCCGNCGGKRTQVDSNLGCMRATLSIMFVALIGIMIPGMAFTNSANDFQKNTLLAADETFYTVTDGFNNYTHDVLKQVDYMVEVQYMFVDNLIRVNLTENTIGRDVTDYIRDDLGVGEVEDSLNTISSDLRSAESAMKEIKAGRDDLIESENQLTSNLSSIDSQLQAINASCGDCLDAFDVVVTSSFTQLPEITDSEISGVENGANSTEEATNEIDSSLTNVENQIQSATNDSVKEALTALDTTNATVEEAFSDVEKVVNEIESGIKDTQNEVERIAADFGKYVDYEWYFFIAVTCVILFILVIMILGFTMGTICYRRGSPLDRSKMSNAGGNCLMAAVFFMFLFFPILIILTAALFGGLSAASSTCQPLEDLEFYREIIDYPDTIVPGYFLGDVIYGNGTYDVTVSGALEACQRDDTLYNAVKMDYVLNFEDLEKEFGKLADEFDKLIGDVEEIPLDFEVLPSDLETDLNNLVDNVGLDDFDSVPYKTVLNESILSVPTLIEYADYLDSIEVNDTTVKDAIEKAASDLRQVQTSVVDPMEDTVGRMKENVDTVDEVATSLQGNVNNTIKLSNEAETAINEANVTAVVTNVTQAYVDTLTGYGDSFIRQTEKQVTNDFATCRNVWDIYYLALQYSCDNVLDSWNAMWFTIGWCTFFFLPSIIVSVKLAKHYRIMKHVLPPKPKKQKNNRSSDEEVGMNDINGYHGNGYDERLLYPDGGRGGMTPVDNPQFIQDEGPIMAYDYKGNPIAPPPAYNYDDQFPRQRVSLLSPYPWTHQISGPFSKERKYWARQSSSLEHMWPHPTLGRQPTMDCGDEDLLSPSSIQGRLQSREPSFEEDPRRGESIPMYNYHGNRPYSYVNPTGNTTTHHGATPPPKAGPMDMTAYNRSRNDDMMF